MMDKKLHSKLGFLVYSEFPIQPVSTAGGGIKGGGLFLYNKAGLHFFQ